ncbi:hypothetical protein K449DRAFT_433582 [Hypoxylon sp. EC38]|nr:hypothetical protein K449DRAFT_433582 [Hypoxylon sp. EC38]
MTCSQVHGSHLGYPVDHCSHPTSTDSSPLVDPMLPGSVALPVRVRVKKSGFCPDETVPTAELTLPRWDFSSVVEDRALALRHQPPKYHFSNFLPRKFERPFAHFHVLILILSRSTVWSIEFTRT